MPIQPIQTSIVTGGVGKTTFLSHLINTLPSSSVVVVVSHRHANSWGLETTHIATTPHLTVNHHQIFDFGSGCICCSPDGDLARLMATLNATQQHRLEQHGRPPTSTPPPPPFTHLFLETTGVADVHPFVQVIRDTGVG